MAKYVALLRGIGPGNPNMRNDKLRGVFEDLGFSNVRTVISSGNVLFETYSDDRESLEEIIENTITDKLGFRSTTVVRSLDELKKLVDLNPFEGLTHGNSSYLLVTFFKNPTKIDFKTPYQPADKPYKFVRAVDGALFSVTDNTVVKTTDLMTWLEKQFGKEITSRTYLTVNRVISKLES